MTEKEGMSKKEAEFHNISVYYSTQIERCPEFGTVLREYLTTLNIVKDMRAIFTEDNPEVFKEHIGKELNGVSVTQETYENALTVHQEYEASYAICKDYLHRFATGKL